MLAMLPAVLDQTILATALPTIAHDLGRLSDVSWVISAYVITAAASTPLWGKLGDRHGRKRLLETSLVLFLAASAVSGLAQDMTWLIVSRAVQGAAAGGLMTLAMAAVADLVSPRERGRYATTGIGLALFGLGFGMVGQVLIVAVQNGVDRSRLGIAMATTTFFRGLGGAIGAAVLGAIFSASAGTDTAGGTLRALSPAARTDVIHGVQTVFLVAAPIATLALLVVLLLKEVPLQGRNTHQANRPAIPNAPAQSNSKARGPALSREVDVRPRST